MAEEMTISEAERLLGVTKDDSRDDIQSAYRAMAKKYHPDAWISAAPAARKKAEDTYKKLATAKRILMNPSLAKPEDEPEPQQTYTSPSYNSPSSNPYQSGYTNASTPSYARNPDYARSQTHTPSYGGHSQVYKPYNERVETHPKPEFAPRTRTVDNENTPTPAKSGSWAATGTSQSDREKFNRAKSFADQFGATRDEEEDKYVTKYRHYADKWYRKSSDVLRWSTSIITTIAAIVIAVYTMMNDMLIGRGSFAEQLGYGTTVTTEFGIRARTFLVLLIVCAVKFLLYDLIIAPAITRQAREKVPFLYGLPLAIGGVAIFLACYTIMGETSLFMYGAIASVLAGLIIGVVYGMVKKSDGDDE